MKLRGTVPSEPHVYFTYFYIGRETLSCGVALYYSRYKPHKLNGYSIHSYSSFTLYTTLIVTTHCVTKKVIFGVRLCVIKSGQINVSWQAMANVNIGAREKGKCDCLSNVYKLLWDYHR